MILKWKTTTMMTIENKQGLIRSDMHDALRLEKVSEMRDEKRHRALEAQHLLQKQHIECRDSENKESGVLENETRELHNS